MTFSEALETIRTVLSNLGSDISRNEYDGLIVKKLEATNTLDEGRATNQTHIAITGAQMDILPYVRADGYFETDYSGKDDALKKYYVAQIPVYIHKENVDYLDPEAQLFTTSERLVHVSIVRSRRDNAADQIQMSMINIDSPEFVKYRRIIHAKSYMILLKRKQSLLFDMYAVKENDGESLLSGLNNSFYKLATNTPVKLDDIISKKKEEKKREELPFDRSKECARRIIDTIYDADKFQNIVDCFDISEKSIKLSDEEYSGKYLSHVFVRPASANYNIGIDGRIRIFNDKEYEVVAKGSTVECRLSAEWVSSELGTGGDNNNYLLALIGIVNKYYSSFLKIYKESDKWYLEYLNKDFSLNSLPQDFDSSYVKRFVRSLLAKPFVILTGNSGAGKTRIAKQFSEYLETEDENKEKNWLIVPVGADWTDNSRVMGYYNPLADNGKGKYEKTGILRLIERANAHPDVPYFLILDEMNLSHVERYFSDFLSHMETPDSPFEIVGYDDSDDQDDTAAAARDEIIGRVAYPANLFVVGTVNIDETTYMFSPKVLDRANVIEFRPKQKDVMDLFNGSVRYSKVSPANDGTAESFLSLAKAIRDGESDLDAGRMEDVSKVFDEVYRITAKYGFEFAYRTVIEIRRYISAALRLADSPEQFDLYSAVDEQLLQKVLPKIHGNRKEIGNMLDELKAECDKPGKELPLSSAKIEQMKGKLDAVQYASFI